MSLSILAGSVSAVGELHDIGINIRVGLHTGECEDYGEDQSVSPSTPPRASWPRPLRRILVSDAVRELAGDEVCAWSAANTASKGVPGLWRLHAVS